MVTALVVEDSLTDREQLTRCLQQLEITVVSVGSSEEALLLLETSQPDVIFLDIVLPGQSGFEFCRDLKTRSEEHTSELQSHSDLVCRLLLEKKKKQISD